MLEAQGLEENNLRSLGEECDWEGNEMKQIEAHKGELTNAHNHKCDGEMSNGTLEEMSSQEEDEALQDSCERLVVEREQEETCNPKENDDEHHSFSMESDSEERLETLHQQERLKERPNDLVESTEDKGLEEEKEAGDIHEIARANVNEEIHEDTKQMSADAGEQEALNSIETDRIEEIIGMGVEDEVEESRETQNSDDNAICTCDREACEEFTGTQEGDEPNESNENIDVLMDEKENEGDEEMEETNSSVREEENDCSSGASADDYDLEKRCKVETSDMTCFMLRANEINQEVGEATATLEFRENYVNLSDTGISSGGKQNEQDIPESATIPNSEVPLQGLAPELNNYGNDLNEAEISMNWKEETESSKSEEVNSDVGSSDEGGSFDDEMTLQPEQINGTIERKERTQEAHQSIETSQSTEKIEENHYKTLTMDGRISEDCQQKEIGVDKEFLKKIDEAKERERAREKERLAVERAIREARERAYAEARERAAVGKATIEARQRKEQLQKHGSVPLKRHWLKSCLVLARIANLDRDHHMIHNIEAHALPVIQDIQSLQILMVLAQVRNLKGQIANQLRGVKLDWERYQRTSERAAKALAEKNKRDLLAQREQAERNRLAESLDADIKRWSSGKQGNLRALLSTLQYILGPDSGWQPVPLTEIVTTAAVKKAYRKATLCVHPDKLQQRGASLQQKYICEKVFDLLKEAWNKFSSAEER
ncbi:hypothetical protein NL676_025098 [Syzygium grande]|nr:hypothetical protein NL676_025098 [Syzygium grande]